MFCTICSMYTTTKNDRLCSFIGGCKNVRLEAVTAHQKSELHRRCAANDNAKKAKVGTTIAEKLVEMLKKQVFNRLTLLFRNTRALAKTRCLFTTFRNDKQAQSFAHFIAQQSRNKMSERLHSTPFLSLISDGTQDHAFMEQQIVFLRNARAGKVLVDIISAKNVEKADATGIHNARP